MNKATIYGIGLGPGDPDLMSVKADRLVRRIKNVAFFRKAGRKGHARTIVEGLLPMGAIELPMEYPVTTEISVTDPQYNALLSQFYEDCTSKIVSLSEQGNEVAILCEGDPFFYGSFMHLYTRLKDTHPVAVIPAITGMSGAWTASGAPITWGDDVLTVLLGTLSLDELQKRMANSDALVIMKIGRNIEKIRQALKASNLYQKAYLIEYATMPQQTVHKLSECEGRITPYFSIIIVHGQGRRP